MTTYLSMTASLIEITVNRTPDRPLFLEIQTLQFCKIRIQLGKKKMNVFQ
jgi:hypothetical protein